MVELVIAVLIVGVLAAVGLTFFGGTSAATTASRMAQSVQSGAQRLLSYGTNHDEGFSALGSRAAKQLLGDAPVNTVANVTGASTAKVAGSLYGAFWMVPLPSGRKLIVGRCMPEYFQGGGALCAWVTITLSPTAAEATESSAVSDFSFGCDGSCPTGAPTMTAPSIAPAEWPETPRQS